MTIAELRDEVARLKAELELETDQADRWSRKATALQAVVDAARYAVEEFGWLQYFEHCNDELCNDHAPARRLREAFAELDKVNADA